jgi:hypothetical protein
MIKLTIEKLTIASGLIADIDTNSLDEDDCIELQQIALACNYHVSVVNELITQAKEKKLDNLIQFRIPLIAAINFASEVISTLEQSNVVEA